MLPQTITILGSTGTIGRHTLDVISRHPERFLVHALTANQRDDLMLEQCRRYNPRYAIMLNNDAATRLEQALRATETQTEVHSGVEALKTVAALPEIDTVVAAIVGSAGLKPALAAAKAGKRILLANKETLVMAGSLFMHAVHQHQATLLPIDSEHNAIFQVLPERQGRSLSEMGVHQIVLTASGGPFRQYTLSQLHDVTPSMALQHPNWQMGSKVTTDSATLMNKGLEVIEAHWLFGATPEQIQVVIHPQSIIHSMIQYQDGSVLAQMGTPDMRTPISYALAYPDRIISGSQNLDLIQIGQLSFESPDVNRFPCLRLAFEALTRGGTAPTILNAANEVAVAMFLNSGLRFMDIPRVIEHALTTISINDEASLEQLIEIDLMSRQVSATYIAGLHV